MQIHPGDRAGSASNWTATTAADAGLDVSAAPLFPVVEQASNMCARCEATGADTAFRSWDSTQAPRRAHPLRGGSRSSAHHPALLRAEPVTSLLDDAVKTGCCCRHNPDTGNALHTPIQVCSTDPAERRSEYEHLVPLHAKHAALPEGDADRERLRAELIAAYMPVARNIARRYGNRGENLDDVEQVASVGLVLAVDRFQPGLGFDFLSFAVPTITGEVLRHFRDRTNAIRVPRRLRALQAMIYTAAAELEQCNRRSARPSEIAERLGVDLEVVIEGLAAQGAGRPRSLDEPDLNGEGWSGRLRFSSALGLDEAEFDLIEHRQALAPLLAALPERERRILVLRFFDELTQTEIGAQVGISQMHVSRLLTRTLGCLRRQLMADGPMVSAVAG